MTDQDRMDRACRELLRGLVDLVDGQLPATHRLRLHAASCRPCQARIVAARTSAALLRRLPPVAAPVEARSPAFVAGICAGAGETLAADLGPVLRAALKPLQAPADAVWVDEHGSPELVDRLRSLPTEAAPGWLWARIRADVWAWRRERRRAARRPLLRVGLLAALVTIGAFLAWWDFSPSGEGTYLVEEPVFKLVTGPLDQAVSGGGWTELGR